MTDLKIVIDILNKIDNKFDTLDKKISKTNDKKVNKWVFNLFVYLLTAVLSFVSHEAIQANNNTKKNKSEIKQIKEIKFKSIKNMLNDCKKQKKDIEVIKNILKSRKYRNGK